MAVELVERWPIVGRDVEIATCLEALTAERSVILAGPAGVGKTQLAREVADRLEASRGLDRVAVSIESGVPLGALVASADGEDPRPRLLVLDDAQLLDEDAAALVARSIVAGSVVALATVRTGTGCPAALTGLWKDDHVDRIDLDDLDRVSVDELLDAVLDGPIEARSRRTLWESTLGSPLMLRELLRSSLTSGNLSCDDGIWRLTDHPTSIRLDELIQQRLDELDEEARTVVDLVALGEPLGFGLLLSAVGASALDSAERSGLVEAVNDGVREEVRLAHPVFGDVARRTMGAGRTAALCSRLVELLESTPLHRRDDIVRSVTWQLRSGGRVVTDDMILAARRAMYDRHEQLAVDLAVRALDGDAVGAALVLADVSYDRGDHVRVDEIVGRATAADRPLDDRERAMLTLNRSSSLFWGFGEFDEAMDALATVAADLADPVWADELVAQRAVLLSSAGRFAEALDIAEGFVANDGTTRPFVVASIAASSGWALGRRALDAVDLAARAHAARRRLGEQHALTDDGIFVVTQVLGLTEAGRIDEAERIIQLAHDFSVADGLLTGQAWFSISLGRVELVRGRLDAAIAAFTEACGAFGALHHHGPLRWSYAGLVLAHAMSGEPVAARAAADALAAVPDHPARMMGTEVDRAAAWLAAAEGDRDRAVDALLQTAERAFAAGADALAGGALHDVVRLGGTVAEDAWRDLDGAQGELAPTRAAMGRAAAAGDAAAVVDVAERFTSFGADLFAAEAAHLAADLHDEAGASREAARCRRLASDAQNRTGQDWFLTLDRPTATARLTERESEIAGMAAAGATSPDIAERLGVSVRTVDNHLQRVYVKLGLNGRHELAGALRR